VYIYIYITYIYYYCYSTTNEYIERPEEVHRERGGEGSNSPIWIYTTCLSLLLVYGQFVFAGGDGSNSPIYTHTTNTYTSINTYTIFTYYCYPPINNEYIESLSLSLPHTQSFFLSLSCPSHSHTYTYTPLRICWQQEYKQHANTPINMHIFLSLSLQIQHTYTNTSTLILRNSYINISFSKLQVVIFWERRKICVFFSLFLYTRNIHVPILLFWY